MGWLAGWDKRIKLDIDYTNKIGGSVTWFPATVFLTSTQGQEAFVELTTDAEFNKVAFTKADGTTELYGECELFDVSEKLGIYHVSRDGWVINANTSIYMYYDADHADNNTYIGAINTAAGAAVWDGNFDVIWHMVDATTSTIKDSTSNNHDFSKPAANEPTEVDGKIGKAQNFDGDEYIDTGYRPDIDVNDITVEVVARTSVITESHGLINEGWGRDGDAYPGWSIYFRDNDGGGGDDRFEANIGNGAAVTAYRIANAGALESNVWYHMAFTRDNVAGDCTLYLYDTGALVDTSSVESDAGKNDATVARNIFMGVNYTFELRDWLTGDIDEIRLSTTARSAPWIKATYNSLWDTLLTYGGEEVRINAIFFGSNF